MKDNTEVKKLIKEVCTEVSDLLCKKNDAYGNSFMYPSNIFCKESSLSQIHVRIDDKLNRIAKGQNTDKVQEDTKLDLIGYLILEQVLLRQSAKTKQPYLKRVKKSYIDKINCEEIKVAALTGRLTGVTDMHIGASANATGSSKDILNNLKDIVNPEFVDG